MHAVFVLPRFYPYRGGYENSMLAIARCLVRRGHRVTVFTTIADDLESLWLPGYKTFPAEEFVVDGITVRRFPICYNRLRRRATRVAGLLPYWRWKAQYLDSGISCSRTQCRVTNIPMPTFFMSVLCPTTTSCMPVLQAASIRRVPAHRHSVRTSGRGRRAMMWSDTISNPIRSRFAAAL